MYNLVHFEISGYCNAHCPWCVQGRGAQKSHPSRFIPVPEFKRAIERLLSEELIGPDSIIALYNYGEPLLHPSLDDILKILADNNIKYTISTNASLFIDYDEDLLKNLQHLFISIPGFSQNSYDKIHGFNFEKILENINKWVELIGSERVQIQYHLYQFNLDEIQTASVYFKQRNVKVYPYCALFNEYKLSRSYLNCTIPVDILEKASKELILSYVEELLSQISKDYICPQREILAIDEYCNILTCCLLSKADPDYSIGSLFSLSNEEIKNGKKSQKTCNECIKLGIAYWVHNLYCPQFIRILAP